MTRAAIFVLFVSVVTGSSVYNFGNGCIVMDDVLYENGVNKGPLTPEQQQQLNEYQQKIQEWNRAVQQSIESNFPWHPSNPQSRNFPWNPNGPGAPQAHSFCNSRPFGPENSPFGSGFPSNNSAVPPRPSAVPPFPSPPPFCRQ